MKFSLKKTLQIIFLGAWLGGLAFGFAKLFTYAHTAGLRALASGHWPTTSQIQRSPGKGALVIFAHPQCPCSEATLGELDRLITRTTGQVDNFVVFVQPQNFRENWTKQKLWQKAAALSHTTSLVDPEGLEAKAFGAQTSGQAYLFDADGKLLFAGGITPSRGHMGDNNGRTAVLDFVAGRPNQISTTPVFGCALFSAQRELAGEKP